MVIGFLKSFDPNLNQSIFPNFIHSVIGGVFGYSVIWLLIFFYKKFKNKEGMGLGDAKLLSALGFWFGWISIPFILIFSSLIALGFSLPSLIKKSKNLSTEIPFGPHLVIGCITYILSIDFIFKFLI
jgi:leader peptidase (prepilin peptidase)/N-methyltransferase|tara:strand:+ start:355 stop:735 length:381 start_codon:yes stop_codon:yes gene_type:complete